MSVSLQRLTFERLAARLRARAKEYDHRAQALLENRGGRAIDPM
jgi:hypothetical protein